MKTTKDNECWYCPRCKNPLEKSLDGDKFFCHYCWSSIKIAFIDEAKI